MTESQVFGGSSCLELAVAKMVMRMKGKPLLRAEALQTELTWLTQKLSTEKLISAPGKVMWLQQMTRSKTSLSMSRRVKT